MLLKEKTNLSWLYGEYIREQITEAEIMEILKDFGYDLKTRIELMESMIDNKHAAEEDSDIDIWQGILEDDVEEAYAEGEVDWI